ncbi:glycoside hydrolase [Coprinopsis sp. MPI-PUGE-AT-0042]|nr:glycoside hydrolase [Coprinopsis sp. MPI-PUGE-AT-0042]
MPPPSQPTETPSTQSSHTSSLGAPHRTLADPSCTGSPSPRSSSQASGSSPLSSSIPGPKNRHGGRAYVGYRNHADPRDELLPTGGGGIERINGWSLTAVETFPTMWLMDMKTVLEDGADVGVEDVYQPYRRLHPFLEINILYLGGYLSAYTKSCS